MLVLVISGRLFTELSKEDEDLEILMLFSKAYFKIEPMFSWIVY